MAEEKASENFMLRIARFIVDKRKAFYLVFAAMAVFCAASINKVKVNDDITSYLPENTETRRGLTIMGEEFITFGSGQIMITSITLEQARQVAEELEAIEGVKEVVFDETEAHYTGASALYSITFEGQEEDDISIQAMSRVKEALAEYDVYISSAVGQDAAASLQKEMGVILMIAAVVILAVLLFTSQSYLEVAVFVIVFAVSALLNMGTNYWFGEISFITNAVAVVLQLALAIDYAIIFCHRYVEERENGLNAHDADVAALSKAIVEISSSSLTTISGLIALMLMQLRIGFDLGIVLCKGILCSLLTVFLLMPGLLLLFSSGMDRTMHKNFVPKITAWGGIVVKTRFLLLPVFLVVLVIGIFLSGRCPYVFSTNSIESGNLPDYMIAAQRIRDAFGESNTIAVLVPKGDYDKEGRVLREVEALEPVTSATGLANIEVEDGRMLTDKMGPRQFAELAGIDIDLARLLYRAYGVSVEEYGAIFQDTDNYSAPLLDVFQFLLEQKDLGVVNLTGEQAEKVEDLQETLDDGLAQLQGNDWSRLAFVADVPEESEETFRLLDQIREITRKYYGEEAIIVGNSTNARDLQESFQQDNLKISVLTVVFVMVILLFTFQSAGLPVLLVLTIQGSIWINFSFPYLTHSPMYFLAYLIVSAIQMGATIRDHQPVPGAENPDEPEGRGGGNPEPKLPDHPHLRLHYDSGRVPDLRYLHRSHHWLSGACPGPGDPDLHPAGHVGSAPDSAAGRRAHRKDRLYPQPGPEAADRRRPVPGERPDPRPGLRLCGRGNQRHDPGPGRGHDQQSYQSRGRTRPFRRGQGACPGASGNPGAGAFHKGRKRGDGQ